MKTIGWSKLYQSFHCDELSCRQVPLVQEVPVIVNKNKIKIFWGGALVCFAYVLHFFSIFLSKKWWIPFGGIDNSLKRQINHSLKVLSNENRGWSKLVSIDHYDETLLPASSSRDGFHSGPEKDTYQQYSYHNGLIDRPTSVFIGQHRTFNVIDHLLL